MGDSTLGKRKKRFKGYKAPKGGRLPGNVGTILDLKREEQYGFLTDEQGIRSESGKVVFESKAFIQKYQGKYNDEMIRLRSHVTIEALDTKQLLTYKIVPSAEVDIFNQKISEDSNLGKSLLGKKNEVITVSTTVGTINYRIIDIKQGLLKNK